MLAKHAIADITLRWATPLLKQELLYLSQAEQQSNHPSVKPKRRIFINGGSGLTDTFGTQLAVAADHAGTSSCSGCDAGLRQPLGAEIIDHTKGTLLQELRI
ncbi:hypothetical protein KCU81_g3248, partial [Aureobasidium melanogenum]|uniref:Uncharacterized protein n=1 Tax=Aureobasidium melanogenum (strain CBS 110374) TaxID=1043003 RepID=A0A074VN12_AURM1